MSDTDLIEFLKEVKPDRVHFLGSAAKRTLGPRLDAVNESGVCHEITADTNMLRSKLFSGNVIGENRRQKVSNKRHGNLIVATEPKSVARDQHQFFRKYAQMMEQQAAYSLIDENVPALEKTGEGDLLGDVDSSEDNGNNADKNSDRIDKIAGGMYVPERLPQGIISESIENSLRAAADVARRVHESVQEGEVVGETYDQRLGNYRSLLRRIAPSESSALRSWAQERKMLLDDREFTAKWKARGEMRGSEHDIYAEDGRVFKRNNLVYNPSLLDYLNRLIIHNSIFPESAYRLEGFVESYNRIASDCLAESYTGLWCWLSENPT